ncbi:MAG: hypothetical protein ACOY93_19675 [Bacillota bacterium]
MSDPNSGLPAASPVTPETPAQPLVQRTVLLRNATTAPVQFYIYVSGDTPEHPVWLAQKVPADASVTLRWTEEWSYFWSQKGVRGEIQTEASQRYPTRGSTLCNLVTLQFVEGMPQFTDPRITPEAGTLTIQQDGSVWPGAALVGFALSGLPVVAQPTRPNESVIFELPSPITYYVGFQPLDQPNPAREGEPVPPGGQEWLLFASPDITYAEATLTGTQIVVSH